MVPSASINRPGSPLLLQTFCTVQRRKPAPAVAIGPELIVTAWPGVSERPSGNWSKVWLPRTLTSFHPVSSMGAVPVLVMRAVSARYIDRECDADEGLIAARCVPVRDARRLQPYRRRPRAVSVRLPHAEEGVLLPTLVRNVSDGVRTIARDGLGVDHRGHSAATDLIGKHLDDIARGGFVVVGDLKRDIERRARSRDLRSRDSRSQQADR